MDAPSYISKSKVSLHIQQRHSLNYLKLWHDNKALSYTDDTWLFEFRWLADSGVENRRLASEGNWITDAFCSCDNIYFLPRWMHRLEGNMAEWNELWSVSDGQMTPVTLATQGPMEIYKRSWKVTQRRETSGGRRDGWGKHCFVFRNWSKLVKYYKDTELNPIRLDNMTV